MLRKLLCLLGFHGHEVWDDEDYPYNKCLDCKRKRSSIGTLM